MTIRFLANTVVSGKMYHAGGTHTFAAADESTQVSAGAAIYHATAPVLDSCPRWLLVGALTYADFSAAATTSTVNLFNLEPRGIIQGIKIKHTVAFAGPSISAYTVSVGDAGTAALLASAFDVLQAFGSTAFQLSQNFYGEDNTIPTLITATAVSTGANLSVATAGQVNIWALLSKSVV
jgi:hypothetical protein